MALSLAMRTSALDGAIIRAVERHDPTPVTHAIDAMRTGDRPTAYHHAIARLWEKFERKLACELIVELAENHHDTHIAQYWLREAMATEPAIARDRFAESFLSEYYKPEVAAQCGKFG